MTKQKDETEKKRFIYFLVTLTDKSKRILYVDSKTEDDAIRRVKRLFDVEKYRQLTDDETLSFKRQTTKLLSTIPTDETKEYEF